MRVRAETQLDCKGVTETPDVSMEVAEIPSVQNCLMSIPEKDTLEVVGSILARPFYTTSEKEALEVVVSILESTFIIKMQPDRAG